MRDPAQLTAAASNSTSCLRQHSDIVARSSLHMEEEVQNRNSALYISTIPNASIYFHAGPE